MIPPSEHYRPPSPKQVRRLGWLLIGIGIFLTLFMGAIAALVVNIMIHSGDPDATTRFNGGPAMIAFTIGIFAVVIGFGVLAILNGAWQVRYSKRNPHFIRWMLWLAAALGGFAVLAGIIDAFE